MKKNRPASKSTDKKKVEKAVLASKKKEKLPPIDLGDVKLEEDVKEKTPPKAISKDKAKSKGVSKKKLDDSFNFQSEPNSGTSLNPSPTKEPMIGPEINPKLKKVDENEPKFGEDEDNSLDRDDGSEESNIIFESYESPYDNSDDYEDYDDDSKVEEFERNNYEDQEDSQDDIGISVHRNFRSKVDGNFRKEKDIQILSGMKIEESDDEEVYPLSIKYSPKKAKANMIMRYILLGVLLFLLIPSDFYTFGLNRRLPFRMGYFADIITEKKLSIEEFSEFSFKIEHCRTYILESKSSSKHIKIFMSSNRDAKLNSNSDGNKHSISIKSNIDSPLCYVEIKVPGGVPIAKMTFTFEGGTIDDLILLDKRDGSNWKTPMIIDTLEFTIIESYPVIKFENEHEINSLKVSGSYCACSFDSVKIKQMDYDIVVGSLNIKQNKEYSENKLTISTPDGTHCVAGATVNAVGSSGCPTNEERLIGIKSTTIDLTSIWVAQMYVCSHTSSNCPSAGDTVKGDQAEFKISQNDGAIQFLIDGSSTNQSNTYNPFLDTFSATSQATLAQNLEDFSSIENDPRMYLYEVISPGYERMWVHSALTQYLHARPWLLSIYSLSILRPTYFR